MAWVLAISAVMNLVLLVAYVDAAEGRRYLLGRNEKLLQRVDYLLLRNIGKEQMKSAKKSAKKGA